MSNPFVWVDGFAENAGGVPSERMTLSISYAGITRIRFFGYDLSRAAHRMTRDPAPRGTHLIYTGKKEKASRFSGKHSRTNENGADWSSGNRAAPEKREMRLDAQMSFRTVVFTPHLSWKRLMNWNVSSALSAT